MFMVLNGLFGLLQIPVFSVERIIPAHPHVPVASRVVDYVDACFLLSAAAVIPADLFDKISIL